MEPKRWTLDQDNRLGLTKGLCQALEHVERIRSGVDPDEMRPGQSMLRDKMITVHGLDHLGTEGAFAERIVFSHDQKVRGTQKFEVDIAILFVKDDLKGVDSQYPIGL